MKSASLQYANALADITMAQGAAEQAMQQLLGFGALYAVSAELRNFLASPAVTAEAKHRAEGLGAHAFSRRNASRTVRMAHAFCEASPPRGGSMVASQPG